MQTIFAILHSDHFYWEMTSQRVSYHCNLSRCSFYKCGPPPHTHTQGWVWLTLAFSALNENVAQSPIDSVGQGNSLEKPETLSHLFLSSSFHLCSHWCVNPSQSASKLSSLCHCHLPNMDTSSRNSFPTDHLASGPSFGKSLSFSC